MTASYGRDSNGSFSLSLSFSHTIRFRRGAKTARDCTRVVITIISYYTQSGGPDARICARCPRARVTIRVILLCADNDVSNSRTRWLCIIIHYTYTYRTYRTFYFFRCWCAVIHYCCRLPSEARVLALVLSGNAQLFQRHTAEFSIIFFFTFFNK